jgi:(p)ppGpp synthase/HD superfamily hydrolase
VSDLPTGVTLIRTAIDLAYKLHDGQRRKGIGLPYIVHPCEVFIRLLRWGIDSDIMLSAAMLHDVLEDCHETPYTISLAVGPKVAALVEELTYDGPRNNANTKARWIGTFRDKSAEALIVKLADRYCNVQDFMLTDPSYARIYLQKADPLFDALYSRMTEINNHFGRPLGLAVTGAFCQLDQELRRL